MNYSSVLKDRRHRPLCVNVIVMTCSPFSSQEGLILLFYFLESEIGTRIIKSLYIPIFMPIFLYAHTETRYTA